MCGSIFLEVNFEGQIDLISNIKDVIENKL